MNSFNDINGIPATGNKYIQRDLLKGSWGFKGFVVSDWGSIGEMIPHGFAKDNKDAALKAIIAGSDMDMESRSYINHLADLVKEGKVDIKLIDDAVRRILTKKYELGFLIILINSTTKNAKKNKPTTRTQKIRKRNWC
jgi:beta-glucosidase